MNERPFEDHTRWQSAIGPLVMARCAWCQAIGVRLWRGRDRWERARLLPPR